MKDGEIVGLNASFNGCTCTSHAVCGSHICKDDLVTFRLCSVSGSNGLEDAIAVVRIQDGMETCTVGFLPRQRICDAKNNIIGQFAQIIELYDDSESEVKRCKSYRNKGMASYRMLDDIQVQE